MVVLFGMAADKECDEAAEVLGLASEVVTCGYENERAADPEDLARRIRSSGGRASAILNPVEALELAQQKAGREGLVVVVGSLYLASLLRARLLSDSPPWRLT